MAAVTSCFLSLFFCLYKNLNQGESFTSPRRQTWCQVTMKWEICGLIPLERSGVEADTCDSNELSCWKGTKQAGCNYSACKMCDGDMAKIYKITNGTERVSRDFPKQEQI